MKFTRPPFSAAYAELKDPLAFDRSEQDVLQALYQYSILGFNRIGRQEGRAGYYYHYHYLDESIRFDPDALSFRVHFGIKEHLELSENADPVTSLDVEIATSDEEGDE